MDRKKWLAGDFVRVGAIAYGINSGGNHSERVLASAGDVFLIV